MVTYDELISNDENTVYILTNSENKTKIRIGKFIGAEGEGPATVYSFEPESGLVQRYGLRERHLPDISVEKLKRYGARRTLRRRFGGRRTHRRRYKPF